MAEPITWITKGGKHIPIFANEPTEDEKKKDREIEENKRQAAYKNNEELIQKIDEMEPTYDTTEANNLIKKVKFRDMDNVGNEILKKMHNKGISIAYHKEQVDISELDTNQYTVYRSKLKAIAENLDGKEISGWQTVKNPTGKNDIGITAVRYKGHLTIVDGNHRVNMAILNGQKQIKLLVVDAPEDL